MEMNFSGAGEQQVGGGGAAINPGSVVTFTIMIRAPKAEKIADVHPMVTKFSTGVFGLDMEYKVVGGKFDGRRIWDNIFLRAEWQDVQLSEGQLKKCNNGDALLKAILESNRALDPATATKEQYNVGDFKDFQGMRIVAKVGCKKPKAGDKYVDNTIMKVLNVSDPEYGGVRNGVDVISTTPVPEIPQLPGGAVNGGGAQQGGGAGTSWGANPGGAASQEMKPQQQEGGQQQQKAQGGGEMPKWGAQNG